MPPVAPEPAKLVESDTIWLRLATAATFIQKKLCCPVAMTRKWTLGLFKKTFFFKFNPSPPQILGW